MRPMRRLPRLPEKPADMGDEVEKLGGGHVRIGGRALGKIADVPFGGDRLRRNVVAADDRGAGGRREKSGDHLHRRRLAGAVRAEKAEHFALRHRERHIVDRHQRAEIFDEMSDLQHTSASPAVTARLCLFLRSRTATQRRSGSQPDAAGYVYPGDRASQFCRIGPFDDPATAAFFGLVMLAYVTMHLLNHALGLISLEAMEDVLWYVFRIWSNRRRRAALRQLPRPLRARVVGAVAAAQPCACAPANQPDHPRLCDSDPPRPSCRRHTHRRQFLPHRRSATTPICCGSISSGRRCTAICR